MSYPRGSVVALQKKQSGFTLSIQTPSAKGRFSLTMRCTAQPLIRNSSSMRESSSLIRLCDSQTGVSVSSLLRKWPTMVFTNRLIILFVMGILPAWLAHSPSVNCWPDGVVMTSDHCCPKVKFLKRDRAARNCAKRL